MSERRATIEFYNLKMRIQRQVFERLIKYNVMKEDELVEFIDKHGDEITKKIDLLQQESPDLREDDLVGEITDYCKDIFYFEKVIVYEYFDSVFKNIVFKGDEENLELFNGSIDRRKTLILKILENEEVVRKDIATIKKESSQEETANKVKNYLEGLSVASEN